MGSKYRDTPYGPMRSELEEYRLEDICAPGDGIQTGPFGSQLHNSDYVSEGTPIITVEHLGENRVTRQNLPRVSDEDKARLSRYTMRTGDIIFSRVGSVDRRAIVREEEDGWLFSGRCLRVRPNPKMVSPEYLSWFMGLAGFKEYIRKIAVGATMPSLNTKLLANVPIFLPSLEKQKKSARVLDSLDDKIDLNRRTSATLEAMARALFKSWFIDFDPVRAKAAGKKTGLPKEIEELFPSKLVKSELGDVPEGWGCQSFGKSVEIIGGGTPKTSISNYWDGDIPWFSIADISGDSKVWITTTEKKITLEGLNNSSTKVLPVGTSIITARGTVGKTAMVGVPMAMNQSCYGLRSKVSKYGYYTYFELGELLNVLKRHAYGSVFDTITRDTLDGVSVIVPPRKLIDFFENEVGPMLEKVKLDQMQASSLAYKRDCLLQSLILG